MLNCKSLEGTDHTILVSAFPKQNVWQETDLNKCLVNAGYYCPLNADRLQGFPQFWGTCRLQKAGSQGFQERLREGGRPSFIPPKVGWVEMRAKQSSKSHLQPGDQGRPSSGSWAGSWGRKLLQQGSLLPCHRSVPPAVNTPGRGLRFGWG